ncbi:DUF926-domain-containing protein [Rhizophagus irregularis]|uniref:DUF926-domain-containing protein n=3 Tax=Rhizophagus irregularis TaxID=588596 RepID=A0A2I1GQY4_9GLOM|nr:hypothetical protein GLOIN_2v1603297 [Rhizophagus irregularis DAOM 181602=DAOM 197198]EXX52675.1 hypothetical protein RirG_251070 [Rhizophagus irregularis DAOM 197198w]PKC06987.1 DUF926-domain-containing protein [Rhizophagus irregularis]PKC74621.1 DUF926-domain-containing protein [Rhizophagus irregularis]PKK80918.1 DUF926-domain-containing protein [Rhizophagus irregularis]PKY49062.1 DUF926-domain-containing protein [Rhizophagus irregularis]|eukprot:XP_025178564.1 hypothetical protein GLOIN_2v1603297 [Rhizophagus irregularis DAOM 181602=DAOM 197198]
MSRRRDYTGRAPDKDFLIERKRRRLEISYSIWPSSPEPEPLSPRERYKKGSRFEASNSDSEDRKRHKTKKHKKSESKSDYRSSKHKKSSKRHKKQKKHRYSSPSSETETDQRSEVSVKDRETQVLKEDTFISEEIEKIVEKRAEQQQQEDTIVGPLPTPVNETKLGERDYGGALLAGEGSAMAAYVQEGKRIPRRGEIGLTSNEIQSFEDVGYVMSGSRHRRMNAVRIRKENQVISAEEKRAVMLFNQEEKSKKENKIISDFRELLSEKMRGKQ